MSVFRRRRRSDEPGVSSAEAEPALEAEGDDLQPDAELPAHPIGPWDAEDVPDDGVHRLDLGGIRVAVLEDIEIRIEVGPDQQIVGATLIHGGSSLQLNAFAAPRREGLWDEVRAEIAASLRGSGGSAVEQEGPFGSELRARVPAEVPGAAVSLQPARFVGVDGPRWFLRGVFTGPAATDPVQAAPLEAAFRGTVVARGREAMAPQDPLPLRLPPEALQAAGAAAGDAGEAGAEGGYEELDPFQRGPEITEVR
jgi:hypothetical protein